MLASGAQPQASVTNFPPVILDVKFYWYRHQKDRVKYGGSTLPKKPTKKMLDRKVSDRRDNMK